MITQFFRNPITLTGHRGLYATVGLALSATALLTSGCGELVNGANLKPSVTYKPSVVGGDSSETKGSAATESSETVVSDGIGTVRGKVEFAGAFTPLPPLYVKGSDVKDAAVCAAVEAPNETILVKDGGLANVFIYLRKAPKASSSVPGESLIFDQKACVFKPHALIARVGQTVKILNSDTVAHNTHTYGKKTVQFNSVVGENNAVGVPMEYKQAEQEPIKVGCDIHPWMNAYHLPIDHPFAAVSGEDGKFEIKDLPSGKHEFKVWHEAAGLLEKALIVTIKPGDNELTIKVTPSQLGK
jgi:plastocyanin